LFLGLLLTIWIVDGKLFNHSTGIKTRGDSQSVQALPESGNVNCGIACVMYLAKYYNLRINLQEIINLGSSKCSLNGLTLDELNGLCRQVGLKNVAAINAEVSDLAALPTPFIMHLQKGNVGHYVVCTKVKGGYIQYVDFSSTINGLLSSSYDDLTHFSGYAIICSSENIQ